MKKSIVIEIDDKKVTSKGDIIGKRDLPYLFKYLLKQIALSEQERKEE